MENKEKILVTRASMPPYEEYIEAIKPLWDSHWLTNMGTYHKALEKNLCEYLDVPGLSLMVNGHMALEMVIHTFGFPQGAEVITTPFTFISTTHAILRNNLTPVFCDIKESDGTIDENKIEALITNKTVAILPVHVYGHVCNVEAIERIAKKHKLKVIYDAAHAFGVRYHGKGIGSFGDASIFSFHATKVFHSIEGGAVSFRDPQIYDRLYCLKNFGIRSEEVVTDVGANAKMNEFCAIMGLCNLNHIQEYFADREKKDKYYRKYLAGVRGIEFLEGTREGSLNYAYFPILVREEYGMSRDELFDTLRMQEIHARKYFYPLTCDQMCFGDRYRDADLSIARKMASEILVLPLYAELTTENMNRIISVIKDGAR